MSPLFRNVSSKSLLFDFAPLRVRLGICVTFFVYLIIYWSVGLLSILNEFYHETVLGHLCGFGYFICDCSGRIAYGGYTM